jgi:hypothetical protein
MIVHTAPFFSVRTVIMSLQFGLRSARQRNASVAVFYGAGGAESRCAPEIMTLGRSTHLQSYRCLANDPPPYHHRRRDPMSLTVRRVVTGHDENGAQSCRSTKPSKTSCRRGQARTDLDERRLSGRQRRERRHVGAQNRHLNNRQRHRLPGDELRPRGYPAQPPHRHDRLRYSDLKPGGLIDRYVGALLLPYRIRLREQVGTIDDYANGK